MFSHEPKDYVCPFCAILRGETDEYSSVSDIVFQDSETTVLVSPKWWPNNPGGVLVIPNKHYENIYSIPDDALEAISRTVKRMSIAIRSTYDGCEGTSNRQHNEPAGRQNVWHFHTHVFPRYEDDQLYQRHTESRFVSPEERKPYVDKLRAYCKEHQDEEYKRSQAELAKELAAASKQVTVGAQYMHYKQLAYTVLQVALIEANNEPCVVYRAEYGEHAIWVRPLSSWLEQVRLKDGTVVPRFSRIE